ncbi:GMC oxidoreductase [Shewanella polaris]|nr:GMC oxidoreductase [Shewanella polaris]
MKMKTEVCIVGSGFAGAIMASRLIDAGFSVSLLERGPWRSTLPVNSSGIRHTSPLPTGKKILTSLLRTFNHPKLPFRSITPSKHGLFEYSVHNGINTACSSGVGGGSHVYGALLGRSPDKNYWNTTVSGLNEQMMDKHYRRVEEELKAIAPDSINQIPNFAPDKWCNSSVFDVSEAVTQPNMGLLFDQAEADSGEQENIKRKTARFKGDSVLGSPSGAKSTVDFIYLIPALKKGLKILDLHEVQHIKKSPQNTYTINAKNLRNKQSLDIICQHVFFAAGTMNTIKLLFKSQVSGGLNDMPMLGQGFGSNGDYSAIWELQDKNSDFTQGTPCHGRVAIHGASDTPNYVLGGVDIPRLPHWVPKSIRTKINRQKHNVLLIGMGADAADGVFSFQENNLTLTYEQKNSPIYEQIRQGFKQVSKSSGKSVRYGYKAVTVHPFGGAKIAQDDTTGVIDHKGEIFNNPELYIVDASALPKAVGGPPSLTIGAWSSLVAEKFIQNHSPSMEKNNIMINDTLCTKNLVGKSFKDLDAIFSTLASPSHKLEIDGNYWGKLIMARGLNWMPYIVRRPLVWVVEKILLRNWKGKCFNQDKGINLFGRYDKSKKALPFNVAVEISRDGTGLVVQLDYNIEKNPQKFRKILGEARQLNETEWLARMYYGDKNWFYYSLKQ